MDAPAANAAADARVVSIYTRKLRWHAIMENGKFHVSGSSMDLTLLLAEAKAGDSSAMERAFAMIYDELRVLARHHLDRFGKRPAGQTLHTTALVHEAYLRLAAPGADGKEPSWNSRMHFYGVAAKAMRSVLVDYARNRAAAKRGGANGGATRRSRIPLDEALAVFEQRDVDILALEEALERLAEIDPRKSRTVELRFFGGLSNHEVATVLDTSEPTVERDWRMAKAWLRREISK